MDKLKELIKGIGGTDDLAGAICEEMERWMDERRKELEEEYKTKADAARQLCLEAVEREKMKLAKRVRVYLESKERSIAEATARQNAIEEAESAGTLRKVKALVEDIDIDDSGTSRKLQEVQKKAARLERAAHALREEKSQAVAKANKYGAIAKDMIRQNRELNTKLTTFSEAKETEDDDECPDDCDCKKCKAKSEAQNRNKAPLTESKHRIPPRRRSLEEGRKRKGKTRSTRPTLIESQVRATNSSTGGDTVKTIDNIAAQMSED